ncbi:hypothetical protein MKX03_012576 [Papaver bracteatum]|nr:hypothetical protein MKX03_012576 [Papaver bracteatum]
MKVRGSPIYKVHGKLGKGGFRQVFVGRRMSGTQEVVKENNEGVMYIQFLACYLSFERNIWYIKELEIKSNSTRYASVTVASIKYFLGCRMLNKDPDPMDSFSFSYLFILFSSHGICSLCYTKQDMSFNFQQITGVHLDRTSWKVNCISLFTSSMCCLIISCIKFSQPLTSHCVSCVDGWYR